MSKPIHAAIFDMDGLLLDSERLCRSYFLDACSELQLNVPESVYLQIIGCNAQRIEQIFAEQLGPDFPYHPLRERWMALYQGHVHNRAVALREGVRELLELLAGLPIQLAVATSTAKELAENKLRLAGLRDYFSLITCGCEVAHSKPDPEIYLLAASRLGIAPEHCIAFEDSANGVRAAHAANMQVVQVPDLVMPDEPLLALQHRVIPSLNEARQLFI
ncbi:HAD family hydrolase [Aliagarivorans marinus]|uniref:HAD family hydrolase n=1 Tax=Aliagarivorans marinus TaxID=561965 RepID=UPI000406F478|nr:HAD family phosphatase [Aliagarivorans marinus]